jgi:archaemetzincin
MKENLFAKLEQVHAPARPGHGGEPGQTFEAYRRSRPARQTARRKALYLSRVGALTAAQERVVEATAGYLAAFLDLPVRPGRDFDPATFPPSALRKHSWRGHPQLLTHYLVNEVLWLDRPEEALVCLAVTAWDLWSLDEEGDGACVLGEAFGGHAGVWSLRYLGDPGGSEAAYRACLARSFATAAHEAAHVLGLDHCAGGPCNMNGSYCVGQSRGQPLVPCPACLRKLCWNRQVDLVPYLGRLRDFLAGQGFAAEAGAYEGLIASVRQDAGATSPGPNRPCPAAGGPRRPCPR